MKGRNWLIVGGLGLALLASCAAILAVFYFTLAQASASGVRLRLFSVNSVKAEGDEEQRFAVTTPAALDVLNDSGAIIITGGTGSEIVVEAHKTAYGQNQADAEAALAAIKIVVTQDGSKIKVRVVQPAEVDIVHIGPGGGSVDFIITVPAQTDVVAHTQFGAVKAVGTHGDADLQSNAGEVRASDLEGGDLKLKSSFGQVALEDSTANNVTAESNAGAVDLTHVEAEGDVRLDSDFGAVSFEQGRAGSLAVDTNSGQVQLLALTVTGALTAHSDFGGVTLEDVRAEDYDLSSNNGDIIVDGAYGAVKAETEFGGVDVKNAEEAVLDLHSNNGSITFAGSLGDGPHTLETEFGSIRLTLPKTAALDFDLKTEFGKIRSDLPITINGSLDEKHWQGTINGGGASLTADTNNGDITIEILK